MKKWSLSMPITSLFDPHIPFFVFYFIKTHLSCLFIKQSLYWITINYQFTSSILISLSVPLVQILRTMLTLKVLCIDTSNFVPSYHQQWIDISTRRTIISEFFIYRWILCILLVIKRKNISECWKYLSLFFFYS